MMQVDIHGKFKMTAKLQDGCQNKFFFFFFFVFFYRNSCICVIKSKHMAFKVENT